MYESEGQEVPEDTGDDVAANIRNARALEYLRAAAETAVLCGSYLTTGEEQPWQSWKPPTYLYRSEGLSRHQPGTL